MTNLIKMRTNSGKKRCVCSSCGKSNKEEQKEFYDLLIGNNDIIYLCYNCLDILFKKNIKSTSKLSG